VKAVLTLIKTIFSQASSVFVFHVERCVIRHEDRYIMGIFKESKILKHVGNNMLYAIVTTPNSRK